MGYKSISFPIRTIRLKSAYSYELEETHDWYRIILSFEILNTCKVFFCLRASMAFCQLYVNENLVATFFLNYFNGHYLSMYIKKNGLYAHA